MNEFEYYQPTKIKEALYLKENIQKSSSFIAGGTDLLPLRKQDNQDFKAFISLKKIPKLQGIQEQSDYIKIGSTTILTDILNSKIIKKYFPILQNAIAVMGCTQMRNIATIGGNVMSAISSSDTIPPLLVLETICCLESKEKKREIPLSDFFIGPRQTKSKKNELIQSFKIQKKSKIHGMAFKKISRRSSLDISIVNLACFMTLNSTLKKITQIKLAAGAIAPTPIRLYSTEKILKNMRPSTIIFNKAAQEAIKESQSWDDMRASKWYREEIIKAIIPRILFSAYNKALKKCQLQKKI